MRVRRPENKRKVYIHLTPKGRLLKSKLVPLAEEVNSIGVRSIKGTDIAAARLTLLAMLENLARDEIESAYSSRRIPVTQRHLDESQRIAKRRGRG
jgi:DNA-binding MarR family transcriptional regulator